MDPDDFDQRIYGKLSNTMMFYTADLPPTGTINQLSILRVVMSGFLKLIILFGGPITRNNMEFA